MSRRTPILAVLAWILACGGGDPEAVDLERMRATLGLPADLPCRVDSTFGGAMQREGLRVVVTCDPGFAPGPSWKAGPPPAVVETLRRPPSFDAGATAHWCRASTLARPNSNEFHDHPCDPLPEGVVHYQAAVLRADGTIRAVYQAYY